MPTLSQSTVCKVTLGLEESIPQPNLVVETARVICEHFAEALIRSESSKSLRNHGGEDFSNCLTPGCA